MTIEDVLEQIIRQKPHLAEPLRFYKKTLIIRQKISIEPSQGALRGTAYPRHMIEPVIETVSAVLELPEGALEPIRHAMEQGEIDFTRLPLGEIPAFSLPYAEDDLAMLLYLLTKPYFLARRQASGLDGRFWEERTCPACRAQPVVTWREEGRRSVFCSFCETTGFVNAGGCPVCGAVDPAKQQMLVFRQEEPFTINTCEHCRSYVKTIDAWIVAETSAEIADLMSLPLDIIVQEQGFVRRAPNPVGMRKITTHG